MAASSRQKLKKNVPVAVHGPNTSSIIFYNNAASLYGQRNPLSAVLVPKEDSLIKCPARFYCTPSPLVRDIQNKLIENSDDLFLYDVREYFNITGTFFNDYLHLKLRLL